MEVVVKGGAQSEDIKIQGNLILNVWKTNPSQLVKGKLEHVESHPQIDHKAKKTTVE